MSVRLSLLFGVPWSKLSKRLTATEWAEYQAADELGLIPNWRRLEQLLAINAGIDPETLYGTEPQDMSTLYETRKAAHAGIV